MSNTIATSTLGKTGLNVTRLSFGAMEIRVPRIWRGRPVTEKQAETILNTVLDEGINFIDTANDYGRSEEFIGRYIAHRRNEFYLATKCGCTVVRKDENTDDTPHVWTRVNLMRAYNPDEYDQPIYDCRDRDVIVVGGGNTAMDGVRTARREVRL